MAKWKTIREGYYVVSSKGEVKRIDGKILKPAKQTKGYLCVCLTIHNLKKTRYVHHLVALSFIGDRPRGFEINHIDGNKLNNSVSNLEYLSKQDHLVHSLALKRARKISAARPATSPDLSGRGLF